MYRTNLILGYHSTGLTRVEINPTNIVFTNKGLNSPLAILEYCGALPHFIAVDTGLSIIEALSIGYGYPLNSWIEPSNKQDHIISSSGVYTHDNEPPMIPLIKIVRNGKAFYQYDYGVISVIDLATNEILMLTRMD